MQRRIRTGVHDQPYFGTGFWHDIPTLALCVTFSVFVHQYRVILNPFVLVIYLEISKIHEAPCFHVHCNLLKMDLISHYCRLLILDFAGLESSMHRCSEQGLRLILRKGGDEYRSSFSNQLVLEPSYSIARVKHCSGLKNDQGVLSEARDGAL